MLDNISNSTPIIVFYSSGYKALANHAAIKKIATLSNADKIIIAKDGTIQDEALQALLTQLIDKEQAVQAIQTAAKQYAQQGYTTVSEAKAHPEWLASYEKLTSQTEFPVDVVLNPTSIAEKQLIDVIYQDNPRLYAGPMIIRVDGTTHDHTAYFTHPYLQVVPGRDIDWRGALKYSPNDLNNILMTAGQAKTQIALESNGDAAIDLALNLTNRVQLKYKDAAFHPIIINAQFVRGDQLERMRQLGVKVSWFAPHLYYWGEAMCQEALGPQFAYRDSPLASAQKIMGAINVQANSPATPPVPLQMMKLMNTREIQSWYYPANQQCPRNFTASEEISLDDALRALALDAAKVYGLEKDKGALIPGKLADMTVLSGDPLQASNLQNIKVLGTVVRGQLHLNGA